MKNNKNNMDFIVQLLMMMAMKEYDEQCAEEARCESDEPSEPSVQFFAIDPLGRSKCQPRNGEQVLIRYRNANCANKFETAFFIKGNTIVEVREEGGRERPEMSDVIGLDGPVVIDKTGFYKININDITGFTTYDYIGAEDVSYWGRFQEK